VAVWVVLLAYRVTVIRVRVPFQPPASVDVAVVLSKKQVKGARERRDEGDVCERPAHEVVAALCGPVDQVVQAPRDEHLDELTLSCRATFPNPGRASAASL
jgi:hypothetical protein